MPIYKGGCYCGELKYTIDVSPDDARTSLCHCKNCKVYSRLREVSGGSNANTLPEILRNSIWVDNKSPSLLLRLYFRVQKAYYPRSRQRKWHNSAPRVLPNVRKRHFGSRCGGDKDFRYIMTGTLDHPGDLPPKGEFWCKRREKWMPEVPGIFHKQEIKE